MSRPRIGYPDDWPRNLYRRLRKSGWYYIYRRPDIGKEVAIGFIESQALSIANELNNAFYPDGYTARKEELIHNIREAASSLDNPISWESKRIVREYFFIETSKKRVDPEYSRESLLRISRKLADNCKRNARCRGTTSSVTYQDISEMILETGMRCAVTGTPLVMPEKGDSMNPWQPSIDRIDCTETYVPENCRVVCLAANFAMSNWGDEVLKTMAKNIFQNSHILS